MYEIMQALNGRRYTRTEVKAEGKGSIPLALTRGGKFCPVSLDAVPVRPGTERFRFRRASLPLTPDGPQHRTRLQPDGFFLP